MGNFDHNFMQISCRKGQHGQAQYCLGLLWEASQVPLLEDFCQALNWLRISHTIILSWGERRVSGHKALNFPHQLWSPDFSWKWSLKHALQLFSSLEAVPKKWKLGSFSLQKTTQSWCVVMGGDWKNGLKWWHLSPWSSCAAIFHAGSFLRRVGMSKLCRQSFYSPTQVLPRNFLHNAKHYHRNVYT
jgi:hypothetical protein